MRNISVDIKSEDGINSRSYSLCVGGGRAYETLLAENQRQLKTVHDSCGFKYLRFHGLLHDDMAVFQEETDGVAYYNWQYVDLLYDAMLKIGIKPFVELSFMPSKLASGDETVFFWRGNITMPRSMEKWEALIGALAAHLIERYGAKEVESWYFEVWNEPNLDMFFASDSQFEDYIKLYASTVKALKKVDPLLRVGGPATAECAWINEFIAACEKDKLPVDFVTTHNYGVTGAADEFGNNLQYLIKDSESVTREILEVREKINASAMPDLELHITEWNSSFSPRDNVHDTYFNAAFIVDRVSKAFKSVDSMSYWTFSDIFEECGPGSAPFHGGFGLINVTGIKKPSYFAFEYLNKLGDTLLKCTDKKVLCAKSGDGVQVLFWDCEIPGQDEPDQIIFKRDLPAAKADDAHIEISGLEPGWYELSLYGTGYRMNDAYTLYTKRNAGGSLSAQDESLIKQYCTGNPIIRTAVEIEADGKFRFDRGIRRNDVYLLTLDRS